VTRYRATINFSRCQRGEVRDFPDDARTAGLVSRGILIPVDRGAGFTLPALEALQPPTEEWFTQTEAPPLLRPPAPLEPADKLDEFVAKEPAAVLPIPERPKATKRAGKRTAADVVVPRS
jgi:hypothetical protein